MLKHKYKTMALLLTTTLIMSVQAMAAAPSNHCALNNTTGEISGKNIDTKYNLASVSKVFTTYWATKAKGLDYRYPTQIYLTDLGQDLYDVHLRGSVYPYFDRSMLYFLISELNKRGVKKINNLTYDENFEYATAVRTNKELAHSNGSQTETEIMRALRSDVNSLSKGYKIFVKKAKAVVDVDLIPSAYLKVDDINYKSMKVFNPATTTSHFTLYSSPMHRILKEMNRNSHNFAADKIYEVLSRTGNFKDFMTKNLNISENEFSFYNGSGYPEMISGEKMYNKSTCRVVATMTQDLYKVSAAQGYGLRYVLPVAGRDADLDGDSTVSNLYSNQMTNGSLVGKTGTIDNTIALGGAMLTSEGLIFFHIGVKNNNKYQDRQNSYAVIRSFLTTTIKQHGGKDTINDYQPTPFVPFDEQSVK